MAIKNFEKCVGDILKDIELRKNVDYGDRASVRRYNAAMNRIVKNAKWIDQNCPERFDELTKLLIHPDVTVVRHMAPIIFGLSGSTISHKRMVIQVSYHLLNNPYIDPASKMMIKANIEKWEKCITGQDKSIL